MHRIEEVSTEFSVYIQPSESGSSARPSRTGAPSDSSGHAGDEATQPSAARKAWQLPRRPSLHLNGQELLQGPASPRRTVSDADDGVDLPWVGDLTELSLPTPVGDTVSVATDDASSMAELGGPAAEGQAELEGEQEQERIELENTRIREIMTKAIRRTRRIFWLDLYVYLLYLALFLAASLGPFVHTSRDSYQLIQTVTTYLGTLMTAHNSVAFLDINSVDDFWAFIKQPFNVTFYGFDPYSDTPAPLAAHRPGWILNSKLVGSVRMRQQRVRPLRNCGSLQDSTLLYLCYPSQMTGHQSKIDFDWPRFHKNFSAPGPIPPPAADTGLAPAEQPPTRVPDVPSSGIPLPALARRLRADESDTPAHRRSHGIIPDSVTVDPGVTASTSTSEADSSSIDLATLRRKLQGEARERVQSASQQRGSAARAARPSSRQTNRKGSAPSRSAPRGDAQGRHLIEAYTDAPPVTEAQKAALLSSGITAFQYVAAPSLSQSSVVTGLSTSARQVYDGGGFAQDFDLHNLTHFNEVVDTLRELAWVDAATRVVILEFTLFAPETDLVCPVRMVVEVHGSGFAEPQIAKEAFRIDFYKAWLGVGRIVLDLLLVLSACLFFTVDLYFTFNDRTDARWYGRPFVWLSISTLLTMAVVIAVRINNLVKLSQIDVDKMSDDTQYFSVHGTAYWMGVERSAVAFMAFLVYFRSFKYTMQIPVVGTIGRTINRSIPQIMVFILMSAVVFLGFAQSFFLGFYTQVLGFQSMGSSMMSLIRFTSGDLDYDDIQRANSVLTPLLYCAMLVVIAFVWNNILIAIVLHAYEEELKAENFFAFDPDFPDMVLKGAAAHPEFDKAAMQGKDGNPALVPAHFNRFILSSLVRFDQSRLYTLVMSDLLSAKEAAREPACARADLGKIYVRIGFLKGYGGMVDTQSIYFPKSEFPSPERAALWWSKHKYHLRVGDAMIRKIKQGVMFIKHAPRVGTKAVQRGKSYFHSVSKQVARSGTYLRNRSRTSSTGLAVPPASQSLSSRGGSGALAEGGVHVSQHA